MSKGLHMSTSTASTLTRFEGEPIRVLIIPGLHNSGDAHWQTWLQGQYKGAVRVHQQDWQNPDLEAWKKHYKTLKPGSKLYPVKSLEKPEGVEKTPKPVLLKIVSPTQATAERAKATMAKQLKEQEKQKKKKKKKGFWSVV